MGERAAGPRGPGATRPRVHRRSRLFAWLLGVPADITRDWAQRFFAVQGIDRAMALGAQAFTALFPMLIVYSSLVSRASGRGFADKLIDTFDLSGAAAQSVRQAFSPASSAEGTVTALGAVLAVVSALSFARALQRLYEGAYGQAKRGVRASGWGLAWLGLIAVEFTIRPVVVGGLSGSLQVVASVALGCVVWLAAPYLLLARRLPWQRLVPGAVLAGVGMTALTVTSVIWLPRSVSSSASQFGVIGVAFALLGWLVAAGVVLVLAATGGAMVDARRRGTAS